MEYQVEFSPQTRKDLEVLPPRICKQTLKKIVDLQRAAFKGPQIKPLKSYGDLFRLRVGDYRVVYQIKGNQVTVLLIGHRKDIY